MCTHVVLVCLVDEMFGLVVCMIDVLRQDPTSNFVSVEETVLKRFKLYSEFYYVKVYKTGIYDNLFQEKCI